MGGLKGKVRGPGDQALLMIRIDGVVGKGIMAHLLQCTVNKLNTFIRSSWKEKSSSVNKSNLNDPIISVALHASALRGHLQGFGSKRYLLYNC
jgi:galactokinase/mevalonate kinase-like predicted kinase